MVKKNKETKDIYTLKHRCPLTGTITTIPFVYQDGTEKEKLTLTEIDAFTTKFDCKESLLFYLRKIGYSFYSSTFFIEYENNQKIKKLDLIYEEETNLKNMSNQNIGKNIIKSDISMLSYIYNLIETIYNDKSLCNYLKENQYISKWLLMNIKEYVEYRSIDIDEAYYKMQIVKNELLKYINIRKIEIGISEYNKIKEFEVQNKKKEKKLTKNNQLLLFDPEEY